MRFEKVLVTEASLADQLAVAQEAYQHPPPLPPGPLPEPVETPSFPAHQATEAYEALQAFYAERPSAVRLRPSTGLPAYLYGALQEPRPDGAPAEAAAAFLEEHELLLTGSDVVLRPGRQIGWLEGLYQVEFEQRNRGGVPLYGGRVACTFAERQLTLVVNTLYGASPEEIAGPEEWQVPDWVWGGTQQRGGVQQETFEVRPVRFEPPAHLRQESRENGWLADRWILPYRPTVEAEPTYRPIWRTIVVDEEGGRWLALIDAEEGTPLSLEPEGIRALLPAHVYLNDQAALNNCLSRRDLDLGAGTDFDTAEHVHLSGPRRATPSAANSPEEIVTANAFYHVLQNQRRFGGLLASTFAAGFVPFSDTDPTADIDVELVDLAGATQYLPSLNKIQIGTETSPDNQQLKVFEPGLDAEVIVHELTHAIFHNLRPGVFQPPVTPDWWEDLITGSLDEGLAFYFPCAFGANAEWAQFAYQTGAWSEVRNLEKAPLTWDKAMTQQGDHPDPVDWEHGVGVWWGRLFWELRRWDALGARTDRLLLQACEGLAGPLSGPDVVGAEMLTHAGNEEEQKIIRQAFEDHGVTLPVE